MPSSMHVTLNDGEHWKHICARNKVENVKMGYILFCNASQFIQKDLNNNNQISIPLHNDSWPINVAYFDIV